MVVALGALLPAISLSLSGRLEWSHAPWLALLTLAWAWSCLDERASAAPFVASMAPVIASALVMSHGLIGPGAPPLEWGASLLVRHRVELLSPAVDACRDAALAVGCLVVATALRSRARERATPSGWVVWSLAVLTSGAVLFPSGEAVCTLAVLVAATAAIPFARGAVRVEASVWAAAAAGATWVGGRCLQALGSLRAHAYASSHDARTDLLSLEDPAPLAEPLSLVAVVLAVVLSSVVLYRAWRADASFTIAARLSVTAAVIGSALLLTVVALAHLAATADVISA